MRAPVPASRPDGSQPLGRAHQLRQGPFDLARETAPRFRGTQCCQKTLGGRGWAVENRNLARRRDPLDFVAPFRASSSNTTRRHSSSPRAGTSSARPDANEGTLSVPERIPTRGVGTSSKGLRKGGNMIDETGMRAPAWTSPTLPLPPAAWLGTYRRPFISSPPFRLARRPGNGGIARDYQILDEFVSPS